MEAVVTGAGSGLGRALALELARRRFNLTLIDCDEERLADLRRQLSTDGVNVRCYASDVSSKSAVGEAANGERTRVDLLINNAATSISAPFESTDPDAFDRVIGVNFLGAVHVTRAFLHRLGQGSQICNVCSSFSWSGFPSKSAYSSSKAALKTFSETLRLELAARGIGVTALYPGPMPTQIVRDGISVDEELKNQEHRFLQKHGINPGHVARVALDRLRRNPARILIGSTYRAMDLSQRIAPSTALWLAGVFAKRSGF
jgi:short-subunit dehydrogenase